MPIQVSEAICFDTAESVQLLRFNQGGRVGGRYVAGALQTPVKMLASVQQPSGKDLQKLPEGERDKDVMKFITIKPLRTTSDRDNLMADVIIRRGVQYKVIYSEDWDVFGQTTNMAARLSTADYVIVPPAPPVCVGSHTSDLFWTPILDYTWITAQEYWRRYNSVSPPTLQAIGGWNVSAFRPTTWIMSVFIDTAGSNIFPNSVDFYLEDDNGVTIAQITHIFEDDNGNDPIVIGPATINWTNSDPAAFIHRIVEEEGFYIDGPNISCIDFL